MTIIPQQPFERRIVKLKDKDRVFYGLEEYINRINLNPINSDKITIVGVSTYKDVDKNDGSAPSAERIREVYNRPEKFDLLDDVIEKSRFFEVLEKSYRGSGKGRDAFSIIIKPNFMFTYNREDRSTFTEI